MSGTPIRGKVARILNTRELAINVGSSDNVEVGMFFDVLDPKGEDIKDPDSDQILGSLERPKVRVQVTKVEQHFSVASTYKKSRVNIGGQGIDLSGVSKFFLPPTYVTKYETLKTTEKTWEDLNESESYVKTGDPVVQVMTQVEEGEG